MRPKPVVFVDDPGYPENGPAPEPLYAVGGGGNPLEGHVIVGDFEDSRGVTVFSEVGHCSSSFTTWAGEYSSDAGMYVNRGSNETGLYLSIHANEDGRLAILYYDADPGLAYVAGDHPAEIVTNAKLQQVLSADASGSDTGWIEGTMRGEWTDLGAFGSPPAVRVRDGFLSIKARVARNGAPFAGPDSFIAAFTVGEEIAEWFLYPQYVPIQLFGELGGFIKEMPGAHLQRSGIDEISLGLEANWDPDGEGPNPEFRFAGTICAIPPD